MQNNKAWTAAVLRGAVSAYLGFLGYQIITNQDTEMAASTARILGGIMIAAAAAFAVYIIIRLKCDLRTDHQQEGTKK
jgi:uncharacterized membrane protein